MIYAVNMVDCMLVLAVGFLIFTVMSMNMESLVFNNMSISEKQEVAELLKQTISVEVGNEINQTPEMQSGSGSGYVDMGKVYLDPHTGKYIMVPTNS